MPARTSSKLSYLFSTLNPWFSAPLLLAFLESRRAIRRKCHLNLAYGNPCFGFLFAHRTLLLPGAQRICRPNRPQQNLKVPTASLREADFSGVGEE
jgi:hypothetical protein